MEKQDDGSYTQVGYVVGHCEYCGCELIDLDYVDLNVYQCPSCGELNRILVFE